MRHPLALAPIAVLGFALALAGCTPAEPAPETTGLSIVASTNVYGSIASTIGGDHVTVTSLIDSAAQDPHSFEASARDQLALSQADLVIENGGGYDPFIDTLLAASDSTPLVINAVEHSGLLVEDDHAEEGSDEEHADHDHIEGFNEHVWYSFEAVHALGVTLAEEFAALDPGNAADYQAAAADFTAGLDALSARSAELAATTTGLGVAITEPVPLYLLESIGMENLTPDAFSEAIEEGADVSPLVLQETLDLVASGRVALLAYNEQTASRETDQLLAAADSAAVPVASFTETLPDGDDYLSWMSTNLDALESALA